MDAAPERTRLAGRIRSRDGIVRRDRFAARRRLYREPFRCRTREESTFRQMDGGALHFAADRGRLQEIPGGKLRCDDERADCRVRFPDSARSCARTPESFEQLYLLQISHAADP